MAIKVKLLNKSIKGGQKSLYLDFYPAIINVKTGKPTRREFLKMYIFDNPRTALEKQRNKNTLGIAEQIRQRRENELNKPEIYSESERELLRLKEKGEQDFIAYFKSLMKFRKGSNYSNWDSALNYLEDYSGGSVRFVDLDAQYLNGFRQYLLNTKSKRSNKQKLSTNSAMSYFNKVKAALKQAYEEEYLKVDLNRKVKGIKEEETDREYLTPDEIEVLWNTPFELENYKRAAFFSILTGMRFVDIQKLTWGEVEQFTESQYNIKFRQQKTKGSEVLPIPQQAFMLLDERRDSDEKVFKELKYSAYINRKLNEWVQQAGIKKEITFHCFRHTFAVIQLLNKTDIFTLMKLLGHRDLKTTLIYAKIVDSMKNEAAEKMNFNFMKR